MSEGASAVPPSLDAETVNTSGQPAPPPIASDGSSPAASSLQSAKDTAINSKSVTTFTASATISSIQNSQAVQDLKNGWSIQIIDDLHTLLTLIKGPVGQSVSSQASKTNSEFKDLYGSRVVPDQPAATGQPLTQYHSMFFRLLSWQNPRATAITFATTLALIFAGRYVNILRYAFKFAYFILGITASLEIAGKMLFDDGLASKMRPRKYWTIPRESLERSLGDVEQLLNFFVIETQRILYAENVYATLAVFASAFLSYWLIKLIPFWGLCLISTCVLYLAPLIYIKNRETIDNSLEHVGNIVSNQASQIKDITAQHTGKATDSLRSYAGEYSAKAQEYIGQAKTSAQGAVASASDKVSSSNFPATPQQTPASTNTPATSTTTEAEPLLSH